MNNKLKSKYFVFGNAYDEWEVCRRSRTGKMEPVKIYNIQKSLKEYIKEKGAKKDSQNIRRYRIFLYMEAQQMAIKFKEELDAGLVLI